MTNFMNGCVKQRAGLPWIPPPALNSTKLGKMFVIVKMDKSSRWVIRMRYNSSCSIEWISAWLFTRNTTMQPFPKTEDENNNDKIIITATTVTMKMTMTTKVTSCHEMVKLIQVTGSEKRNAFLAVRFLS